MGEIGEGVHGGVTEKGSKGLRSFDSTLCTHQGIELHVRMSVFKKPLSLDFGSVVGYDFFFERIVVFGRKRRLLLSLFRSKRMRNKAGEYLGTVKDLIPVDDSG